MEEKKVEELFQEEREQNSLRMEGEARKGLLKYIV